MKQKSARSNPLFGIVAAVILVGVIVYLWSLIMQPSPAATANDRMFMCTETNKTFMYTLKKGETEPVQSPHSGKNTGWRADACYWTKDGKAKKNPTWVVVKRRMGIDEDTFCPDCGSKVEVHNRKPPPEEMDKAQ